MLMIFSVTPQCLRREEGLPVNAVERLLIVNKVDIQRRIPLQGLFQNDAQGCDLIRARSLLLVGHGDTGLLRLSFGSAGCDSTPSMGWTTV
ncbi:hypothetical protein DPMN_026850 [Dreissena polymorpha]|uniref:Uncharacterized protein n=1 Tax=Dreissena polymorpha TaxID=45954 RepID=A0A9D4LU60_DREPO|nr:hypothetical protein DPMN_026850 [Dreissena polymorpha]